MIAPLIIAPAAPPTLAAESIIFRRFLLELDMQCEGQVFRSKPTRHGWSRYDASMEVTLQRLSIHDMQLPLHESAMRLLRSRFATRLHCPDANFWLQWMDNSVMRRLTRKPDILYSRFAPFGASMLPYTLKQKLNIPWIMHLSDPWPELPANHPRARAARAQRDACFAAADKIAFTTQGQSDYYAELFPQYAHKYFLSPNPVPDATELAPYRQQAILPTDDKLHLVFTGSMYGYASFQPLIDALKMLENTQPRLVDKLCIRAFGNLSASASAELAAQTLIQHEGTIPYNDSMVSQAQADILLALDHDERDPMWAKIVLKTKVVSALGLMRPLLAITCKGSVTDGFCQQGYGWSVAHGETERLAALLASLIEQRHTIREKRQWKEPPAELSAALIVQQLLEQMQDAIATYQKGSA
jgi:hypothetical protein